MLFRVLKMIALLGEFDEDAKTQNEICVPGG
jgi:hypothetical protein